jgi:hypothetical protein
VGALGHFLEREGIATTGISLVREHTETVRPPRALWVTFELGRPLGLPDDPPFQRRVVKAALDLLGRTDDPLIADYPEHVMEEADFTGWACPISLAPMEIDSLAAEIDQEVSRLRDSSECEVQSQQKQAGKEHPAERRRGDALAQHLADLHTEQRGNERQHRHPSRVAVPSAYS